MIESVGTSHTGSSYCSGGIEMQDHIRFLDLLESPDGGAIKTDTFRPDTLVRIRILDKFLCWY